MLSLTRSAKRCGSDETVGMIDLAFTDQTVSVGVLIDVVLTDETVGLIDLDRSGKRCGFHRPDCTLRSGKRCGFD